ncbi:MAG: phenylalanine--tRNA ligase subunit beta [Bryobacteraceae bacterium]|nr:phenylalanine--tRNA ligase subunit beta [Bryobacteraceae bacterium]MDW8377716.1 phenylalanine--tRNA ligase subunit beta [Bryobacterales bacterium]
MRFSYNWLKEMALGLATEPRDLMNLITLKTAECEGLHKVGQHFSQVVAAKVLQVEPLGSGRNRKTLIDAGPLGQHTVVCGAPNCRPGVITVWVPPGTRLEDQVIGVASIDGVSSAGMLASGRELGINRDHEGILEIEAEPGALIPGCQPDFVIEVDNKSLTHRPDLWGHHGMAREVAAILGLVLRDPVHLTQLPQGASPFRVSVEDSALCPRYSALVVENVQVRPSPLWLQYRLQAIGLNPINNVVDVTNYVMAELGQPMHAFDAEQLAGDTIFVRPARDGEPFDALNDESYRLTPAALVIADKQGAIALAGVIGGKHSAISQTTTKLVLESANFQAANIRRTSVRLKLRTDASQRFEKSQDPANTVRALARAVELLEIVSPGCRVCGGVADAAAERPLPPPIELPVDWLIRKLGREIAPEQARQILEALQFGVDQPSPRVLTVRVPSWRATKDISIKDDLVEEIGRMIGYDTITPTAPVVPTTPPYQDPRRSFLRRLRHLVAAQGFDEVYNYSFVSEELARRFELDPEKHVRVANPISVEQGLMRQSLIPGIWRNVVENSKHWDQFRLFEIGFAIHPRAGSLPEEIPHLTAAIYSRTGDTELLFEMKRLAECVLEGCELRPCPAHGYEHPARTAEVLWREQVVGRLFEFHPRWVETGRAVALDLNLATVESLGKREKRYQPVRRFPSSAFDLSVVVPRRTLVGDLEKVIRQLAGADLDRVTFLRQYEGPPLEEGLKSVSFRITVAAPDHTLSNDEVSAIRERMIRGMRAQGYELRV